MLSKTAFSMLTVWTFVNVILLVLFLARILVPAQENTFSGVFHDRNVFSITTLIVMVFSVEFVEVEKKKSKNILLKIMIIFNVVMIIISKSVTGFSGLIMLSGFYVLRQKCWRKITLSIIGALIIFLLLFTSNPLSHRIDRFTMAVTGHYEELRTNESAYVRPYLIMQGIRLFSSNLLTGVGINNASNFFTWPSRGTESFLHNTYLDILTSGGIILFIVYYIPIIFCFVWILKNRKTIKHYLSEEDHILARSAFGLLLLKLLYDMTWTTYFEFFMVFSVIYSIYITFYLKRRLRYAEDFIYS